LPKRCQFCEVANHTGALGRCAVSSLDLGTGSLPVVLVFSSLALTMTCEWMRSNVRPLKQAKGEEEEEGREEVKRYLGVGTDTRVMHVGVHATWEATSRHVATCIQSSQFKSALMKTWRSCIYANHLYGSALHIFAFAGAVTLLPCT
jgi:hypothetical protein